MDGLDAGRGGRYRIGEASVATDGTPGLLSGGSKPGVPRGESPVVPALPYSVVSLDDGYPLPEAQNLTIGGVELPLQVTYLGCDRGGVGAQTALRRNSSSTWRATMPPARLQPLDVAAGSAVVLFDGDEVLREVVAVALGIGERPVTDTQFIPDVRGCCAISGVQCPDETGEFGVGCGGESSGEGGGTEDEPGAVPGVPPGDVVAGWFGADGIVAAESVGVAVGGDDARPGKPLASAGVVGGDLAEGETPGGPGLGGEVGALQRGDRRLRLPGVVHHRPHR
ncbi:hypothetical protein [Micromonospora sp. HUAS LYJ1]|uniref:hypothetical protein n=1 Tax=Micromonospora sp. HUAS LYJ1 TaxID=3061626 RepID=UPI00267327EE|nr:hypothetical protein [Micromonospora sp. HUAS LYJ1]WKU07284.1 hypothetical protein Q2K16_09660 [Micromonospora sp. HUAS LYJ1]